MLDKNRPVLPVHFIGGDEPKPEIEWVKFEDREPEEWQYYYAKSPPYFVFNPYEFQWRKSDLDDCEVGEIWTDAKTYDETMSEWAYRNEKVFEGWEVMYETTQLIKFNKNYIDVLINSRGSVIVSSVDSRFADYKTPIHLIEQILNYLTNKE